MSDTTTIQSESTTKVLSHPNGKELAGVIENKVSRLYSTLEHLPGSATNLSVDTTGEELGRLFTQQPDLPGVILFDESRFTGVISQAHYYKCISRAFGREIYHRRPSVIMLAEITVEPLMLFSDCTIESAVVQCLGRPADFVYEPFLVHNRKSDQYRLCAFQMLLLASSQLAALRSQQMEQILNSVTDGLLVIDKNFRIGGEYSKVVGKIFERTDLGDASLPEVLQPLLDAVTYEQLHDYLKILFDPKLIDRLIKPINPAKQISARFPSKGLQQEKRVKHFAVNFERIRIQSEISQVLVRIEDITQRMDLAQELERQEAAAEEKLHLVMQILQVEPDALNRFLARFDDALSVIAKMFEFPEFTPPPSDTIHVLFRHVHTLKGEAALLRFTSYERTLHKLEDRLEKMRSKSQLEADDLASIGFCRETLQTLVDQVREALDQLKSLGAGARLQVQTPSPSGAPQAGNIIETLSRLISDLSARLGKPTAFHTAVKSSDFPEQHTEVLHEILIHLARNSMVHGIESIQERTTRGKNPHGLIQLDLKSHPEFYEIVFQDDGRGLDYDKIRIRVAQLGWILKSEDELRSAIFEPGFSTAEKVTDLAGRGVGLDIIRHILQKAGGRIVPYSEPGVYCAFQILLPKTPHSPSA